MKTQRQMTREAIRMAGLHRTKARRREYQKAFEDRFGYEPAKLSKVAGVGKPSRYTVKRRVVVFDQRGKPIGERLVIKRLAKRGQGKGGGGGERESHKTGSAAAKKSVARLAARLGGKRGERPRREKKKKKK